MTTLIISAPHQLCDPRLKIRQCDLAAGTATKMFCSIADRYRELDCIYLFGDEYRIKYDLNRKISRNTPFRQRLDELFEIFSGLHNCAVIDMHSFPDEYLVEAGDINFFKPGEVPPEVVLLKGPLDEFRGKSLAETLCKALKKKKVDCKIIDGIGVNDILNNGAEHSLSGILIEWNERFNHFPDRLEEICKIIASTLASI